MNEVVIESSGKTAAVRNPWLVLFFTILTFGIYTIFWWYWVNRELADLGRARGVRDLGDNPTLSVVAYVLGGFVYVPLFWTVVTTNQRIQKAQRRTVGKTLNGWVSAAFWLFTVIGGPVYMQFELNKVWRAPGMRPAGRNPADPELLNGDAERLEKLESLRDQRLVSQEEFEAEYARLGLSA